MTGGGKLAARAQAAHPKGGSGDEVTIVGPYSRTQAEQRTTPGRTHAQQAGQGETGATTHMASIDAAPEMVVAPKSDGEASENRHNVAVWI